MATANNILYMYGITFIMHKMLPAPIAKRQLEEMVTAYVQRSKHGATVAKLRELLGKVTDDLKLSILRQIKNLRDMTALHEAAYRDDAEMITTILSSLQSSDRLKLLMKLDASGCTPLQRAAARSCKKSVKALLDSLTAQQQLQLLTKKRAGDTAIEMASGETFDTLLEYGMAATNKARNGEFCLLQSFLRVT